VELDLEAKLAIVWSIPSQLLKATESTIWPLFDEAVPSATICNHSDSFFVEGTTALAILLTNPAL
jgi:hypothetical protein